MSEARGEGSSYGKFYISEKFKGNESYKKLFLPNQSITHKSSYYQITIDYTLEVFQARRILRIDLNFLNTSNTNLNNLTINTHMLSKVIAI